MEFTDFHENHRISPETAIFTEMLVSQKGAPRKHQGIVTFIKDSGAGGGGSWIFTENMEILEILRKHRNVGNSQKHGNHRKSRNPEKRKSVKWENQRKIRGKSPDLNSDFNTVRISDVVFVKYVHHSV